MPTRFAGGHCIRRGHAEGRTRGTWNPAARDAAGFAIRRSSDGQPSARLEEAAAPGECQETTVEVRSER